MYLVQNEFMIDFMKQKQDINMYVEMKMTTKSPHYNQDGDVESKYYPLHFDFYRYKNDEYLYTVGFPAKWIGEMRIVGPVNDYDFGIFVDYSLYLENTYETYEGVYSKLNAHFYLKGDDPNIEAFLDNFLTHDDIRLRNNESYREVYKDMYFYFICTDVFEPFEYWYIVMTPYLPDIQFKNR